jgi:hypothetical protein
MDQEESMNDQPLADRVAPRIALVTCAQVPELDADTRGLLGPLAARGVAAEAVVWDDPTVDWAGFDLAVVRSCWDYVPRRAELLASGMGRECTFSPDNRDFTVRGNSNTAGRGAGGLPASASGVRKGFLCVQTDQVREAAAAAAP